jgi:hypothetical protein
MKGEENQAAEGDDGSGKIMEAKKAKKNKGRKAPA